MRSESGVSLVSGALQSSLARAKRIYHFQSGSSNNNSLKSEGDKEKGQQHHLAAYCKDIGSAFASFSTNQFLELGNSLQFSDGGFLHRTIPDGIIKDCIILKQDGDLGKKKSVNCDKKVQKTSPLRPPSRGVSHSPDSGVFSQTSTTNSPEPKQVLEKSGVAGGRSDWLAEKINKVAKLLKDKTIGKNKKKRLVKKLKTLEKRKKELGLDPDSITASEPQKTLSPLKAVQNLPIPVTPVKKFATLTTLSSSTSKSITSRKMGPEIITNGHGGGPLTNGGTVASPRSTNSQLPEPQKVLFPKERITLGWRNKRGPGAGFHNFGNTCYLNSSLQALFHIPAFVNWILNDEEHRSRCNGTLPNQTPCIICVVYVTLQDHSKGMGSVRPRVLDKLKAICKHFSYGRQEDAHEFLRYLLEGMERSYLTLVNGLKLDNRSKETNPLGQIFGGYIRTEVTCHQCNNISTTFQPSAELQLDIRHSTTLEDALQLHFRKERLDNNDYKCEKCRRVSQATKQFSLELPPLVLCLQLKRFTLFGNKISKRIHCNKYLHMSKYLHKSRKMSGFYQDNELKYRLVALVTHLGQSPNCGHYTAIAEGFNSGSYYQFDDQFVQEVSPQIALNNDAYVIIYEMERNSNPASSGYTSSPNVLSRLNSGKPCTVTSTDGITNGATPKKFLIPFAKTNGTSTPAVKPLVISNTDAASKPSGSNVDRKLISLGIRSPLVKPVQSVPKTPPKITPLKPGVILTNSARIYSATPSPTSTHKPISDVPKTSGFKLVPYNDVDNDEDESEEETGNGKDVKKVRRSRSPTPLKRVKRSPSPAQKALKSRSPTPAKEKPHKSHSPAPAKEKRQKSRSPSPTPQKVRTTSPPTPREKIEKGRSTSLVKERTRKSLSPGPLRNKLQKSRSQSPSPPTEMCLDSGFGSASSPKTTLKSAKSSSLVNGWSPERIKNRSSAEREEILKKARNPSPNSPRSRDLGQNGSCDSAQSKESFSPSQLDPAKSIVGWDGADSLLSKSIDRKRQGAVDKSSDTYDEELDTGRNKKRRRSRSPVAGETNGANKFQSYQDRQKLVNQWSSLLNGYGDGFKDHAKLSPSTPGRKPWGDRSTERKDDNRTPRSEDSGFNKRKHFHSPRGRNQQHGGRDSSDRHGHRHHDGNRNRGFKRYNNWDSRNGRR